MNLVCDGLNESRWEFLDEMLFAYPRTVLDEVVWLEAQVTHVPGRWPLAALSVTSDGQFTKVERQIDVVDTAVGRWLKSHCLVCISSVL